MDKQEKVKQIISEDAVLAASLEGAKTPEEKLAKLRDVGCDVTEDDLKGANSAALSDEDLDQVAGGIDSWK